MNIPNYLTLFRIFLIPIFVGFFYLPWEWGRFAAAIIFALAGFTDWLDGYLARTLQQVSHFGAFLDPVADKLLVGIALVLLVGDPHLPYIALPAAVIVGREIVISALREWMAEMGKRTSVAVSLIGKIKTTMQMLAVLLLIIHKDTETSVFLDLGYVSLYLAALLTIWSMMAYLKLAWPNFFFEKK